MDGPQSHPCVIVGLGYEGRAQYVVRRVSVGDLVDLRLEADNPYDPLTVAAYHRGHHIGYIAPGWRWVAHSLEQGDRHEVVVSGFEYDPYDALSAVEIEITVLSEPNVEAASPPAPGAAPWAPRIVHAPRPRWPVIIPLALLAAVAAGTWLLMERGVLPHIGRLAFGP